MNRCITPSCFIRHCHVTRCCVAGNAKHHLSRQFFVLDTVGPCWIEVSSWRRQKSSTAGCFSAPASNHRPRDLVELSMQWELRAIHYNFKRFKHTCYKLTQNFGKIRSLLEWPSRAAGLTLHNVAYWHETCQVRWSVINKKVLRAANGVGQSWTVNKGQSRWNISSSPSSSERYILI